MKTINSSSNSIFKTFFTPAFIMLLTLLPTSAITQNGWGFIITATANFSTKNLSNAKLKTGFVWDDIRCARGKLIIQKAY